MAGARRCRSHLPRGLIKAAAGPSAAGAALPHPYPRPGRGLPAPIPPPALPAPAPPPAPACLRLGPRGQGAPCRAQGHSPLGPSPTLALRGAGGGTGGAALGLRRSWSSWGPPPPPDFSCAARALSPSSSGSDPVSPCVLAIFIFGSNFLCLSLWHPLCSLLLFICLCVCLLVYFIGGERGLSVPLSFSGPLCL